MQRSLEYHLTEMCSGSEAGSYLRLIDSCITQVKAEEDSRTCDESRDQEKNKSRSLPLPGNNWARRKFHLN